MDDNSGGYRRDDPDTSKDAAESISASKREAHVYEAISKAGKYGATWWELQQRDDMIRQTISPAFAPLRRKGFIQAKRTIDGAIVKRPGETGHKQIVWVANKQENDDMSFDLGERIKQVRMAEAKMEAEQEELDAKQKPLNDWVNAARAEILQFLNQTNQKSANTEFGGCHWKPKTTWRVEDKDEFRRHVIGAEAWELLTWAATPSGCEAFIEEHKMAPPGVKPNTVNVLYITPPTKPKGKNKVVQA